MNTPSHFLINLAVRKALRAPVPRSAIGWGAILPDIPLGVISIGSLLYYRYVLGQSGQQLMSTMFDDYYFNNPWWIAGHNFLHSPTLLLIMLAVLWKWRGGVGTRAYWLFWFLCSCLGHSVVDILTHVHDGPVLFFPFDWHLRFQSAVSYWDPRYYGREFAVFELTLDLVLLGWFLLPPLWKRIQRLRARPA